MHPPLIGTMMEKGGVCAGCASPTSDSDQENEEGEPIYWTAARKGTHDFTHAIRDDIVFYCIGEPECPIHPSYDFYCNTCFFNIMADDDPDEGEEWKKGKKVLV